MRYFTSDTKHFNYGENNPSYKGDKAKYGAVHIWVRRRKIKPVLCERCKKRKSYDLANKSGKYSRSLDDWEYLCRKCHMDDDGRNEKLRLNGKSRKFTNKNCKFCNNIFHPPKNSAKFCTLECYHKATKGKTHDFFRRRYPL